MDPFARAGVVRWLLTHLSLSCWNMNLTCRPLRYLPLLSPVCGVASMQLSVIPCAAKANPLPLVANLTISNLARSVSGVEGQLIKRTAGDCWDATGPLLDALSVLPSFSSKPSPADKLELRFRPFLGVGSLVVVPAEVEAVEALLRVTPSFRRCKFRRKEDTDSLLRRFKRTLYERTVSMLRSWEFVLRKDTCFRSVLF